MSLTHTDGGYRSRKWVAYLISSMLMLVAGRTMPTAALGEVIMGLISCLGIYVGGNGFRDWIAMRSGSKVGATIEAPPKDPAAKPKSEPVKKLAQQTDDEEGS